MSSEPSDGRRFLLIVLYALWLMTFVYAFVAISSGPIETGNAGAPNTLATYMGWQGIAGIFSLAIFAVGLSWPKGSAVRRTSRLPILLAVLQSIGGLILFYGLGNR